MTSAAAIKIADDSRRAEVSDRDRPATSRVAALWTLYTLTLRQHLHGKRWMVMIAMFMLPASLAILIRATARHPSSILIEFFVAFMLIPLAMLPLIALLYASGMIQDEQEEQTITYLLVRPIPKWALYCTKLVANFTTAVVLTVVLVVLTYSAIYVGAGVPVTEVATRCAKAASVDSLAVVAYCSLFGLISLLTKRTLVVGIIYTAVVEGVFAVLPFGIRLATVIYYTRLIAYRMLEFQVSNSKSATDNLAADVWQFDVGSDPQLLQHPSTAICLTVLLVGSLVCALLAAWLCSQREFYVKTPEAQ
jgi:ABC-2 type transport system permease protein